MMHHLIGAALLLLGAGAAAFTFIMNSQTPLQLGPFPFFGGCAVAFVGLLVWGW